MADWRGRGDASEWVHAYRDETAAAIEHCQIARVLAPSDPLAFVWATGIAAASFEAGCYQEAARWYERTLAEEPRAVVLNRFAAPTHLFAGNDETARRRGFDPRGSLPRSHNCAGSMRAASHNKSIGPVF